MITDLRAVCKTNHVHLNTHGARCHALARDHRNKTAGSLSVKRKDQEAPQHDVATSIAKA